MIVHSSLHSPYTFRAIQKTHDKTCSTIPCLSSSKTLYLLPTSISWRPYTGNVSKAFSGSTGMTISAMQMLQLVYPPMLDLFDSIVQLIIVCRPTCTGKLCKQAKFGLQPVYVTWRLQASLISALYLYMLFFSSLAICNCVQLIWTTTSRFFVPLFFPNNFT